MSLNAAMLRQMQAEGLDLDACIRIAEAGETEPERSPAAVRQARYRKRKAEGVTRDVTGNVTPPPKENIKPTSVSDETDGEPSDPVKDLFDVGVSVLKAAGHDERHARSLIGKWRKTHSDGEVLAALVDCRTRAITNPVEWMPRRLNGTGPPKQRDHADIVLEEYALREASTQ